jgi:hypothetical protein
VLWRLPEDFWSEFVQDMKADFGDNIALREGPVVFTSQGQQFSLSKANFPSCGLCYSKGVLIGSAPMAKSADATDLSIEHQQSDLLRECCQIRRTLNR